MQRWKAVLSYDGSSFRGWQTQPGLSTVQGTLAAALYRMTGETVLPQGSGRTDAGVHALAQVASFDLQAPIPPERLHRALNRLLPASIRVLSCEPASPDFHARHSALRKAYEYRIFARRGIEVLDGTSGKAQTERICSPMMAPYLWDCPLKLDLDALQRSASYVLGRHDFTSFAAVDPEGKKVGQTVSGDRTIFNSTWQVTGDLLSYHVTGSGFLHHMVRNLVGTFIDCGCGRTTPDRIPDILQARSRAAAGATAPARGLFLVSVDYSE